uniref:Glyco_hydro_19_cat domain-containing protein n=1 Tax=Haemonchus contortus TaxID=6289 RepID=A0A7I5E573_HAECO
FPQMKRFWIVLFLTGTTVAVPTARMCATFAKFVEKWNPLPETLLSWSKSKKNCDKIQPRPSEMTCEDIQRFIADCNYGEGGPERSEGELLPTSNRDLVENYYQRTYGNYPKVLGKYIYYNAATASDYGQFGNWYYPNYYPPTYLGYYDGRPESLAQLENDYKFAKGGHYPYNRADNIINIGLQQTYLPTCLHDLFYCIRASNPSPYQNYYSQREAYHHKRRRRPSRYEDEIRRS